MKIATAPTLERIEKLINQFYMSTTCKVINGKVFNSKGEVNGVEVVKVKNRFVFQTTK